MYGRTLRDPTLCDCLLQIQQRYDVFLGAGEGIQRQVGWHNCSGGQVGKGGFPFSSSFTFVYSFLSYWF